MWKRMQAAGDIYEAEYDGMYCVGCESAKTEDEVVLENGVEALPDSPAPVENVKEKNYFFRLSKYKQQLLDWYDRDRRRCSRRRDATRCVRSSPASCATRRCRGWRRR
jgi:methionyl-tRNA synthetase